MKRSILIGLALLAMGALGKTVPQSVDTESQLASGYLARNDCKDLVALLESDLSPRAVLDLTIPTIHFYAKFIEDSAGAKMALEAIDKFGAKIEYGGMSEQQADQTRVSFTDLKARLLAKLGRQEEAVHLIDESAKALPPTSPDAMNLGVLRKQLKLIGQIPMPLSAVRTIGTFRGISTWKGKVVLLDFFAHWCKPCIASFPDMEQMYRDLHSKGLEIVGVTSFYGYFQDAKGLSQEEELARMQDFTGTHQLPWPVIFVDGKSESDYGVGGIPQVDVIGRDGLVHSIETGYTPASFRAFRSEVEKLLEKHSY